MQDDIKSIFNLYESNAIINNTTNDNTSYMYAPREYPQSREENQETKTTKAYLIKKLEDCLHNSKSGSKEQYAKILFDLQDIQNIVKKLLL